MGVLKKCQKRHQTTRIYLSNVTPSVCLDANKSGGSGGLLLLLLRREREREKRERRRVEWCSRRRRVGFGGKGRRD